ncbi:MAG: nicotinate (nicotinamide) nucleotide adenylyltransferase [Oscillospiraceae bacterium]|jgi:nicotinate-nucleotide adenylyltransferase|nr:nicotinate (nicotinamide) nucleotide adenylyltransferase [Oscillospiraceae bacterium]
MKIGIYGGAFNPPHRGHTDSAAEVVRALGLDRLFIVPSGTPPHKALPKDGPTGEQRLEMARIAFRDVPGAEVSDIEVYRPGESYTVDTVRELSARYPGAQLFLIVGTDMYLTLRNWKDIDEILSRVTPAVTLRSASAQAEIAPEAEVLRGLGVETEIIRNDAIDVSSSQVRAMLPKRQRTWHIDENVYSYIIEHGLYGAKANFDWLRLEAYRLLKPERIRHVAGCELEAVSLAVRWGADIDEAREAGILHDITKRLDVEEQLALCERYGIEIDDIERASPKLLHSKTAAALAFDRFNVSGDVKSAILWHTTGHADMTLLEKIIYTADYIEPNRDFDGVEELRRLAYRDIDAALIAGMDMSIADMTSRGISPHPVTLAATGFLKERVK